MECTHEHDKRSEQCRKCRMKNNHPRSGTGKDWALHKTGYMYKCIKGRWISQHRYVMEQHLGRKLATKEIVHHRNHDRADNRLENLELLTWSDHAKAHSNERVRLSNGQFTGDV